MLKAVEAIEFLTEFLELAKKANERQRVRPEYFHDREWLSVDTELVMRLEGVNKIIKHVLEKSEAVEPDRGMCSTVWSKAVEVVTRAIGALRNDQKIKSIIGPQGPAIAASNLHEWVWQEAATAWDAGLFRNAVQAAASRVERETKIKVGRDDLSGHQLANEAWSAKEPSAGRKRLQPTRFGSEDSQDYRSALDGSRFFHLGVTARIRNIASHDPSPLDEQEGLEQLAALSLLARWVEDAEVQEGSAE